MARTEKAESWETDKEESKVVVARPDDGVPAAAVSGRVGTDTSIGATLMFRPTPDGVAGGYPSAVDVREPADGCAAPGGSAHSSGWPSPLRHQRVKGAAAVAASAMVAASS